MRNPAGVRAQWPDRKIAVAGFVHGERISIARCSFHNIGRNDTMRDDNYRADPLPALRRELQRFADRGRYLNEF